MHTKPLTIYVAASVRHKHAVRLLHDVLRECIHGVQILDWTEKAMPPAWLTVAQRRDWYDTDSSGEVYTFCRDACIHADIVVYYGASGQDAGVEVGMAHAVGVPVIGLIGPLEAPGLMLHGAVNRWLHSADELVALLRRIGDCNGWCMPRRETCISVLICEHSGKCNGSVCESGQYETCPDANVCPHSRALRGSL